MDDRLEVAGDHLLLARAQFFEGVDLAVLADPRLELGAQGDVFEAGKADRGAIVLDPAGKAISPTVVPKKQTPAGRRAHGGR